jgi:hypothetical protein
MVAAGVSPWVEAKRWPVVGMSNLLPGDEDLHYSDGSHRWMCPYDGDDDAWSARMHATAMLTAQG